MSSRSRELWSSRTNLRRWLLIATTAVTIFGLLHHLDHVVRSNHSGWPLQGEPSPFAFSLLIYALLVPGLYLTLRGRLMAGYWLCCSRWSRFPISSVPSAPSSNPEIVSKTLITRPDGGNLYFGFRNRITFNFELGLLSCFDTPPTT